MHKKPDDLLVNDDVLSCGPLPSFRSPEQWTTLRGAYWHSVEPGHFPPPSNFNRDFLTAALAALPRADSVVLWIGMGIAEQLLLVWLVHLLKLSGSRAQLSVVQFTRVGKRNMDVWGLGLLNPEQIQNHPPAVPLPIEAIDELDRCWAAVTSPDPAKLLSLLSDSAASLTHCRSSFQQLVHRYPDHKTGLGRWDYELLKYTKEIGPSATRVIGHTMGYNFGADLVGDGYLFSRLLRLGAPYASHPLVSLSGDPTSMRDCEVALTDVGELVFTGRANAIELNAIDDWVAGVHLDSKQGTVWCRKDGALVAA